MASEMRTGLDVLRASGFAPLRGKRVGLVTHPAAVDTHTQSAAELFAAAPDLELAALFGPEHGFTGEEQDLIGVPGGTRHPQFGCPVYSLYGDTFDSLKPTPDMFRGLDVLVIDLVDVGSRYYTFQATMLFCLEAAAAAGLPVVVLDRWNPLGRTVEGPTIRPGFESFVGIHPIPTRHGLTIGELARLYAAERGIAVDLRVIGCELWGTPDPEIAHLRTWVPPSPNMPGLETALVYPGMCLVEGTNLSEGRGTTRPFEYVGFPGLLAHELVDRLNADLQDLPAVRFLPAYFRPTFQKHAGQTCGGAFLVITAEDVIRPVRTGLAVIDAFRELLGDRFHWRTERYEFVDHIPAIDLLFGSDRERLALEAGVPRREIAAAWEPEEAAFRERRKTYLLYPEEDLPQRHRGHREEKRREETKKP
jgi:uncharacterized protein YbbC (DUF1343 family)